MLGAFRLISISSTWLNDRMFRNGSSNIRVTVASGEHCDAMSELLPYLCPDMCCAQVWMAQIILGWKIVHVSVLPRMQNARSHGNWWYLDQALIACDRSRCARCLQSPIRHELKFADGCLLPELQPISDKTNFKPKSQLFVPDLCVRCNVEALFQWLSPGCFPQPSSSHCGMCSIAGCPILHCDHSQCLTITPSFMQRMNSNGFTVIERVKERGSPTYTYLKLGNHVKGKWVTVRLHRFILWAMDGVTGSNVCMHVCNNKACLNPHHLVWGDNQDNHISNRKGNWDAMKRAWLVREKPDFPSTPLLLKHSGSSTTHRKPSSRQHASTANQVRLTSSSKGSNDDQQDAGISSRSKRRPAVPLMEPAPAPRKSRRLAGKRGAGLASTCSESSDPSLVPALTTTVMSFSTPSTARSTAHKRK